MNFFESELKKIMGSSDILKDQKFVGRMCYGTIGCRAGKVLVLSGLRVYLPEFSVTVHEGIFCDRVAGKLQPDYFVTAIADRNTGTLLYDEESDFTECVFHWQEEKYTLAQIEAQKCVVKGIEVRDHENTVQTARGRGNY